MIISHKHKFIFIKTKKTAGTSLEIALSKYCGPDDIITPISEEDEILRSQLQYRGPQNYNLDDFSYYSHISAKQIKEHIDEDIWNSYYKFCFERNIYEKIISFYYWEYKDEPRPSMMEFLASGSVDRLFIGSQANYKIDGEVVVDDIYQFEKLEASFSEILHKLSIDDTVTLPQAKTKYRKDKSSYQDILSPLEIQTIDTLLLRY